MENEEVRYLLKLKRCDSAEEITSNHAKKMWPGFVIDFIETLIVYDESDGKDYPSGILRREVQNTADEISSIQC